MSEIEFLYIGWCKETDADGTKHDKVWTAFKVNDRFYAGWGARGKKISFKDHGTNKFGWPHTLATAKRGKEKKYNEVDSFQLFAIFPFFKDDVEKHLCYALLANKIK